jgi:alanine racemase
LTFSLRPTSVRIDLSAIVSNFSWLKRRTESRVLAVVKADAYGHGAAEVSAALERAGADFFCVAIAEEGIELRRAGIRSPILLLNTCLAKDVFLYRSFALTPTLGSLDQAREFSEATREFPLPLAVHVKIDTGLTRLGILPAEIGEIAGILRCSPGLSVEAAFSHFSHGDEPESPVLASQNEKSREALASLSAAGVRFGWTHLANSGSAVARKGIWCDAVRPGLSLYGVSPMESEAAKELEPAMTWETEVIAVKTVPQATPVGYGGTFVTRRESRLAILPIGYDDGYRRSFSGRVPVLLPGGAASTIGAISMDLTVCDATQTGARKGDRVVLLGKSGNDRVTAHDLARAAGTIPYEIFCGIGPRVPRRFA